jgi:hypothetical protein
MTGPRELTRRQGRWPDFFIVGAPRCATTAMCHFLRGHPSVFMPGKKEPHFFGSDLASQPNYIRDERQYRALFAKAGHAERVGEASVFYLVSRRAAREIKTSAPAARIIVQLRDPVEVMYSLHNLLVRNGQEPLIDFEAALAGEPDRAAGRRPRVPGFPLYREAVQFTDQVSRFFAAFGREAVHVVVYDDLCRDPAGVCRGVLAFLGVSLDYPAHLRVVNPGGPPRSRILGQALSGFPWIAALARRVVPVRYRSSVWQWARGLNTRREPRPPLAPELRSRLRAELRDEVERLSELLGRDLTSWSRS